MPWCAHGQLARCQTPYGLRRQLLDENGAPKATLENGQRRSRRAPDRIILTPGPLSEIEVIRDIFTSFVERRRSPTDIATELNTKGIRNAVGNPWQAQTVNHILRNERYIGHYVYNRTSFKLQTKLVRNPVDMWVRCDDAFMPIISRSLFDKAQKRLAELRHGRNLSDDELLSRLRALWKRKGNLSGKMIRAAKNMPDYNSYVDRFGSILNAYKRIGFQPKRRYEYAARAAKMNSIVCSTTENIISHVEKSAGTATFLHEPDLLSINGSVTVAIAVAWSVSYGEIAGRNSPLWEVRKFKFKKSDLTMIIRMDASNSSIQDYFLVPTSNHALSKDQERLRVSEYRFRQFRYESFYVMMQALLASINR